MVAAAAEVPPVAVSEEIPRHGAPSVAAGPHRGTVNRP